MSALKRKRGGRGPGAKNTKRVKFVENGNQEPSTLTSQQPSNEFSIPAPVSQGKWRNKERVLVFSSRGIDFRTRHLMQDLKTMMPHTRADTKMDRKDKLFVINEVCEMKNLHTLAELKMTGNCLKGSRPLLSFDPTFDKEPHYSLLKELFIQTFSTPQYHPKSQPFVDHVFTFTITDNRIWFRNYQIIEEDASLVEIGPRFVLNLIKIFQGSFGGPTLYENPHFQSPNMHRRMIRLAMVAKQRERHFVKELQKSKRTDVKEVLKEDVTDDVFETPAEEKPVEIETEAPELRPVKKGKLTQLKRKTKLKRKGIR
uniref:Ribosome biogenesis protein BRX1 homolog n=1 Tax=Denticeps clupeoides TaxID=299321 RepID=A0AAY4DIF2_9TELE